MDTTRAEEILNGKQNIDVEHQGVKVWINKVNKEEESAMVHPVHEPANIESVPVSQLEEV